MAMKHMTLRLPPALHERLKLTGVLRDMSMGEISRDALDHYLSATNEILEELAWKEAEAKS